MSAAPKLKPDQKLPGIMEYEDVELSQATFHKFAKLMYDLAGVDLPLSPKNLALVKNRIVKVLRRHSLADYDEYWSLLQSKKSDIINEFISALTTNMTSFYRESSHFEFYEKVIPEFFKTESEVRVWCAAASTGQEPYTIAISSRECTTDVQASRLRILATDIDNQVLAKGNRGVYEDREMQGLSPTLRQKYFDKARKDGVDYYRAQDSIHKMIKFANFNLVNGEYKFKQKFHVIFCRNVLIYFDEPTTKKVIENLASCLLPGGYLILGHSESGNVKSPQLKPLSRAVYQKV